MKGGGFPITSYSHKELSQHYRCSAKTFKKWVRLLDRDIGPRIGRIYNPRQVQIIVQNLGEPREV